MSFGGNTTPKKKLKPAGKPWACKCGQAPSYLVWCPRCKQGRPQN